jgi:hypothetical protein
MTGTMAKALAEDEYGKFGSGNMRAAKRENINAIEATVIFIKGHFCNFD